MLRVAARADVHAGCRTANVKLGLPEVHVLLGLLGCILPRKVVSNITMIGSIAIDRSS